jgi:hypothetical protein
MVTFVSHVSRFVDGVGQPGALGVTVGENIGKISAGGFPASSS